MKANKYVLYRKDLGYCEAYMKEDQKTQKKYDSFEKLTGDETLKGANVELTAKQIKHYKSEGF